MNLIGFGPRPNHLPRALDEDFDVNADFAAEDDDAPPLLCESFSLSESGLLRYSSSAEASDTGA